VAGATLVSAGTFAWGLEAACAASRVPFARALALQRVPPPYDLRALEGILREMGLASRLRPARLGELARLAAPFLALISSNEPAAGPPPGEPGSDCRLVLVLSCDGEQVRVREEGEQVPKALPLEAFGRRYRGEVLLFAPAASPLQEEDPVSSSSRFGFRWFLPELLRHRAIWRDVLAASAAIQLMSLATPIFTQIIVDKVIVHQTVSTLLVLAAALAAFIVFTAALSWARQYLILHTGNRIDAVLAERVFAHLFRLPARYFENRPTGVLVARVNGVETIREFLSSAAVLLVLDVPFLLIFLAIMFHYSAWLTLLVLAALAAIAVLSLLVMRPLRERLNRQFLLGARNQAFLTEYVAGMETVKALQLEPQLERRFGDFLASYLAAAFDTRRLAAGYNVAAGALEQALALAVLVAGAWLVMTSREFTVGMLVAFQMLAARISQPVLHLVGLWQQFQQAEVAVRRLGDIMNTAPEPHSVVPAREVVARGRIEIRGLGFRHAPNLPYVFRGLSVVVEPGECIAVTGPSGCGKSTLAKLLQGFYLPEEGEILLDGRDLRHLAANELRLLFGVVPQETVLFSGTIYENLVLANPQARFDEVVAACRLAEIHETIERLPRGYQSRIGEHGAGLSGGQKQRIAIARALLKNPRVLIFDEATSNLDAAAAEQLARTVGRFRGRITILFIAHELPRGLAVDRVVELGVHPQERERRS
jgi:subfamily B ATP-binding cassette protein HlyB/CyaB